MSIQQSFPVIMMSMGRKIVDKKYIDGKPTSQLETAGPNPQEDGFRRLLIPLYHAFLLEYRRLIPITVSLKLSWGKTSSCRK